jgi:DNA phosphorothioation-dependent restriction protein DptG
MGQESFESMLTGGHPNSLGRTIEVVDLVFANSDRLLELFNCYFSTDEIVRLRTSNALKRISREKPEWLIPYIDRLIAEISTIQQASTQWTLADLFQTISNLMSKSQRDEAQKILQRNLETATDWIVLNNTMETLGEWAMANSELKEWLLPHLERLGNDPRKSVSGRAKKLFVKF